MSIAKKLHNVAVAVKSVPKTGNHSGYDYHTREDAFEVRPALLAEGVTFTTRVLSHELVRDAVKNKSSAWNLTIVELEVTFECSETGETATASAIGHGADGRDHGASKAQTNALKNALLNTFFLGDEVHGGYETAGNDNSAVVEAPLSAEDMVTEIAHRIKELEFNKKQYQAVCRFIAKKEEVDSISDITTGRLAPWHKFIVADEAQAVREKVMSCIDKAA